MVDSKEITGSHSLSILESWKFDMLYIVTRCTLHQIFRSIGPVLAKIHRIPCESRSSLMPQKPKSKIVSQNKREKYLKMSIKMKYLLLWFGRMMVIPNTVLIMFYRKWTTFFVSVLHRLMFGLSKTYGAISNKSWTFMKLKIWSLWKRKLLKSGEQSAPKLVPHWLAQYLEDYNVLLINEDTSLARRISNELDCDIVYCVLRCL